MSEAEFHEEKMPPSSASLTEWRLSYARIGIYTLLVHGIDQTGCCGCKRSTCKHPGKHPIFPLKDRGATINPDQIRREGKKHPNANLGIHLGLSGLACVDVDPRHGGTDTLERLEAVHGALNTSVVADTGGGGSHHFLAAPAEDGIPSFRRGSLGEGVDLLFGNRYPVVAPSRHSSGEQYRWRAGCDPWAAGWLISPAPKWVRLALEDETSSLVDDEDDADFEHDEDNSYEWSAENLTRLRSALTVIPADDRDVWLRVGAALHHASNGGSNGRELWDEWALGSDDFSGCPGKFDYDGQEATWDGFSSERSRPVTVGSIFYMAKELGWSDPQPTTNPDTLGDISNGRRFSARYRDKFLFVKGSGNWLRWDGLRWAPCDAGQEMLAAKALADELVLEAGKAFAEMPDDGNKRRHGLALAVHRSLPKLYALMDAASSEPGMSVGSQAALDHDPLLLGVKNGVLDLRSGRLVAAEPHQRISKQAGAVFDLTAKCLRWEEFLHDVFQSEEVVAFVQRLVGYTLTGLTDEEVLIFMFGTGANGKSVFANVLTALLGEYAVTVGTELLARNKAEGETARYKARLRGARLALANEVGQADTWDDQRVKEVTSRELIPARQLYGEAFAFTPSHALWIRGNHQPTILDASHGMWRRLVLLPFQRQFAPEERIPDLDRQLIDAELTGVLAWAVRGCLDWQRGGLRVPASISGATEQYRSESDVLGQWIADWCEPKLGARLAPSDAYEAWKTFCLNMGMSPGAQPLFTRRLKARGVRYGKSNGAGFFIGLQLKSERRGELVGEWQEDDGDDL